MAEYDSEDEFPHMDNHALLIPLVVNKIFKCLPIEDLLNCRLVIKIWDEEAIQVMKKRFAHSQDSSFNEIEFRNIEHAEKFQRMYENNQSKILSHRYNFRNLEITSEPMAEILFKFIKAFENIKGIHIEGGLIPYNTVIGILEKCKNLEEFQMKSWFSGYGRIPVGPIECDLRGLKKLYLEPYFGIWPLPDEHVEDFETFGKKMIESAPNLESIRIGSELYKILKDMEYFNFAALKEISITRVSDMTGFLTLPVQLNGLEVKIKTDDSSVEFYKLLKANSKSLQVVKININDTRDDYDVNKLINFSASDLKMEKLKQLHITTSDQSRLRIGPINYSQTFPVLEEIHLIFDFDSSKKYRGMLRRILENELFPTDQNPLNSVRTITVIAPFHRNLMDFRLKPSLKGIFPNLKKLDSEAVWTSRERGEGFLFPFFPFNSVF